MNFSEVVYLIWFNVEKKAIPNTDNDLNNGLCIEIDLY